MDIILNDETGIVVIYRNLINNTKEIFDLLMKSNWRREELLMVGKTYLAKRLLCTYGDEGITYSFAGKTEKCVPWNQNEGISRLKKQVSDLFKSKVEYNYAIVNFYEDHNSKIGYHSDKEKDLVPGASICSISLGATREFRLQPITKKFTAINRNRPNLIKIDLNDGDMLIMAGNLQKFWKHAVLESKTPCDPRINITFRLIKNN